MCGISGFYHPTGFNSDEGKVSILAMCEQLDHRGPDGAGHWLDADAGIALGHRRLSIIDLSPSGQQPMVSVSGRYVIVFNGEIYNHLQLRKELELEGHAAWRGRSDTESLLVAIEVWGLKRTLKACVGMFALALWDRKARTVSLARDRMGEKPLYYGWQSGAFLFASELKALRVHPAFESKISEDVLPLYLRHGYIPSPWCIWKNIRKLLPGTYVTFSARPGLSEEVEPRPYWSFLETALKGQASPFVGSDQDAIDALEEVICTAVSGQMMSDVPLGAFLSGGIDSSTVVSLMQAQSSERVKTFTIGFSESDYNEAVHAKAIASHLGTDHAELYVTAEQAQGVIPNLPTIYDEPFGDSSAIPTYLVSCLARQSVTVSLSGDGGDELFGGYGRYFNAKAESIWRFGNSAPLPAKNLMVGALRSKIPAYTDSILNTLTGALGRAAGKSVAARSAMVANLMRCRTHQEYYRSITSQWTPAPTLLPAAPLNYGLSDAKQAELKNPVEQMMAQDSVTYLPDDILVKVDRAAMAVSLESRVPLLDHRVVEMAWRLPYNMKVRNGDSKWLLKEVLYRHVPRGLMDRPKMGFGVPIDHWLRGPLRSWGEDLLSTRQLAEDGFLDTKAVRERWDQHQKGHGNWRDSLWGVLMWQAWLAENCP